MHVVNKIKDEIYKKLIEYAFKNCDAVMFVTRSDGFDEQKKIKLRETEKYIEKEFSNSFLKKEIMHNGYLHKSDIQSLMKKKICIKYIFINLQMKLKLIY